MAKEAVKLVKCPGCQGPSVYATSNAYRPFCSARCKGVDLGAWASEEFRLPAVDKPDDMQLEHGPIH
jgi:endogenous inhibitor of DNA gyrase (YacG/DUF329 family)